MHAGVLQPDLVPEPGHHDQECRVCNREAPASAACVACVYGEDRDNADLKEEIRARPPVKSAMQLEIQRAVGPGDPGQREDDREFEESDRREVRSQMISRLGDDGGVDKVVEKLERTDTAVDDRLAMRARRAPEPVLEELKRSTGRRTRGSCSHIRANPRWFNHRTRARSHVPSGVSIDLDLRALSAYRNRDRARSDGSFPIPEPEADLAGGARRHLPVAGVQCPLIESRDGGDTLVRHEDDMASPCRAHLRALAPELRPWVRRE